MLSLYVQLKKTNGVFKKCQYNTADRTDASNTAAKKRIDAKIFVSNPTKKAGVPVSTDARIFGKGGIIFSLTVLIRGYLNAKVFHNSKRTNYEASTSQLTQLVQ